MSHSSLYVGANTNLAVLDELADQDGTYQTDATVTLESLVDQITGDEVAGLSFPIALNYVADSDGKYQGTLSHAAELTAGRVYVATFQVVSASGLRGEWRERALAERRED